jgi:hypothetical protein
MRRIETGSTVLEADQAIAADEGSGLGRPWMPGGNLLPRPKPDKTSTPSEGL